MIEIGLAENIQRQDLNPLEEAEAFRTLIEQRGYSQRSLAERIGKDKGYVENRLAILRAPEDVQQLVVKRLRDTARALDYGHADLWMADDAAATVWTPVLDWLRSH